MTNEEIIEGDLILTSDYKTEKNLIVRGNIYGKYGIRYNIDAWNINAWDIICETRTKKSESSKTKARIFITDKDKMERKEW